MICRSMSSVSRPPCLSIYAAISRVGAALLAGHQALVDPRENPLRSGFSATLVAASARWLRE